MNIRLDELILKDFMSFEDLTIDLSKNLTSIIGQNGSGKSSILEALALTFQVKERGSAVGNYIRRPPEGIEPPKKAYVTLKAHWLDEPLTIESVFSETGRKITRKLTYKGEVKENTEANKFLSEYFEEVAMQIAFALQGNEKFLKPSKTDNMKTLQSLFKIDFDDDVKQVKEDISTATVNKDSLNVNLYRNQGSLEQIEGMLEKLQNSIKEDTIALQNAGDEKSIGEIGDRMHKQMQTVAELQAKYNSYLKTKEKVAQTRKAISDLEAEIAFKQKKMDDIVIEAKVDPTEKQSFLNDLKLKERQEFENQKKLTGTISELNTNIKMEVNRTALIASGFCPTCKQKVEQSILDNDKSAIESMRSQLENAKLQLEASEVELKAHQDAIRKTTTEIDAINKANSIIDSLSNSKESIRASIEALIKQKEFYEGMELIDPTSEDDTELKEASKLLEELRAEFNIVNDNNVKIHTLKEGIKNNTASVTSNQDVQKKVKDDINTAYEEISKIENDLRLFNKAQYAFTACPRIFLKMICKTLEVETTKLVKQFGHDRMIIEVDEKGIDFFLVKKGNIILNYAMLSTFEKNLVNLSLVCILETFFDMPFICIDELDASADPINTQRLSILIDRMLQDAQVVAISHDASLVSKWIQNNGSLSIIELSKTEVEE